MTLKLWFRPGCPLRTRRDRYRMVLAHSRITDIFPLRRRTREFNRIVNKLQRHTSDGRVVLLS